MARATPATVESSAKAFMDPPYNVAAPYENRKKGIAEVKRLE
jgi:hypothetical protein